MNNIKPVINDIFGVIFKGINFIPHNYSLFNKALTHKDISSDNYEVLECLGDGWLKGFIITAILRVYPNANEGFISEARFTLENTDTFAYLLESEFPEIIDLIRVKDEIKNSKALFDKVKEDVFEAIAGALISYVFEKRNNLLYRISEFYINMFVIQIKHMQTHKEDIKTNYIRILNNHCLTHKLDNPIYQLINKIDIGNGVSFKMSIKLNNTTLYEEDATEKAVKQKCAKAMLDYLKGNKKYENNTDISEIEWFI